VACPEDQFERPPAGSEAFGYPEPEIPPRTGISTDLGAELRGPKKLAVVDEPAAQTGIDKLQIVSGALHPIPLTVSARELEVEPGKADKPCYGILFDFPRAMAGLARILLHGREKYGGTKQGRALPDTPAEPCYESLLRHYEAIRAGEEIDPDSGAPHVMCLLANAFLAADKWGYRG
jgi:hypothetical protein